MTDWLIYQGTGERHDRIRHLPPPPPWRSFDGGPPLPIGSAEWQELPSDVRIASSYRADPEALELVNAALYLRRPLLVTGKPGVGKSGLAYSVAYELGLGPVLRWPVTSRSTLQEGLYSYDAIGRLQEINFDVPDSGTDRDPLAGVGDYVRLGPLGTSLLPFELPRVLLIDEVDKSDMDLPNDLLNLFEYPSYTVHELARIADRRPDVDVLTEDGERVRVHAGRVQCRAFPFVVLTSNGEREFPPAFLRRCLRLDLPVPDLAQLAGIVRSHLGPELAEAGQDLLNQFAARRLEGDLAADQLLNAIYLTSVAASEEGSDRTRLAQLLMRHLDRIS